MTDQERREPCEFCEQEDAATNQERLAELIGKKGYRDANIPYSIIPLPISELIEIAEKRLFAIPGNIKIETHAGWTCVWYNKSTGIIAQIFGCKTEQEARMACAIAGLTRLQEEEKKDA